MRVVAIARLGMAMLMTPALVAQEGDLMYLAVASADLPTLNSKLATSVAHSH